MDISINSEIIYHNKKYDSEVIKKKIDIFSFNILCYKKHQNVLIYLDRTPDILYSLMAIFKLGLTFVPISINTPKKRIEFILNDSNIDVVITNSKYKSIFDGYSTICVEELNDSEMAINYPSINEKNISYIIYTSGTSGHPKGVEISYGALFNFICGLTDAIKFNKKETIAFFTEISFDISIVESIVSVILGFKIILSDEKEQRNPRLMAKLIKTNEVSLLQITPSRLLLLQEVDDQFSCFENLKTIMVGGEHFPQKLLCNLQKHTKASIYNMYGPTEATIWVTASNLTNTENVNIGKPMKNSKIYIVDENLKSVNEGEIGEIVISGKCLANGYINNAKLNDEKFVYSDFCPYERMYRTGDLGKVDNGILECLGRKDNQIKLNGYRIELEEIEKTLETSEDITRAMVYVEKNILIALCKSSIKIDEEKIKLYLRQYLPIYMIPSVIYQVKDFIYNCSGKIDRQTSKALMCKI